MHLWDRILPQAVITLNMMRTSRINPKISAATHIFGQYDFNRAPMAPPGTRIIAHETPGKRRTWAPHGQDGWYIGPALEHYRCYTVYITKTRSTRVVKTVEFFPHQFKLPFPSSSKLDRFDTRIIKPATRGPILSGRRRTGDRPKKIGKYFRSRETEKWKRKTYPPR
jgi:hypothetical protein